QRIVQLPARCEGAAFEQRVFASTRQRQRQILRHGRPGIARRWIRQREEREQQLKVGTIDGDQVTGETDDDADEQREQCDADPRRATALGAIDRTRSRVAARCLKVIDRAGIRRDGPTQPFKYRERFVRRGASVDRGLQQSPRLGLVATLKRRQAFVEQLFGLTLTLRKRAASPFDVGAGPRVIAIEKQRPCPDVDRMLVLGSEVVIQADEEELLNLGVVIARRRRAVVRMGVSTLNLGQNSEIIARMANGATVVPWTSDADWNHEQTARKLAVLNLTYNLQAATCFLHVAKLPFALRPYGFD
ncbi:MAG TPA: hypothetical protein VF219_18650, partial [Vicinamibacterales bacterium]